jgi:hypothetical protein
MIFPQFAGTQSLISGGLGAGESLNVIGVRELQKQLRRIAVERGLVEIDPAQYDGTLTLGTIMALANAASSAANMIGSKIHPVVGKIVDVFGQLRGGLGKIPYAGQVLSVVFSPWLIDRTWDALLGVMRLIPGGGKTASTLQTAVNGIKGTLGTAAAPIAAALAVIPKPPPSGLGSYSWGTWYRAPVFYNQGVHGPLGHTLGFWNPVDAVVDTVEDIASGVASLASSAADAIKRGAETAWDYTSKAAKATWQAVATGVDAIYTNVKKYGCMLVNNEILVTAVATGAGIVATPATGAAVAAGASAGKAGCAALSIAELLVAIIRLLAQKFPGPAPLTEPTGAALPVRPVIGVATIVTQLRTDATTTAPPTPSKADAANRLTGRLRPAVQGQLLLPASTRFDVPKATYAGCFVRYNQTRKIYAIYCPTSASSGLGAAPAGTSLVAEVPTRAEAGSATPLADEADPIYKRPWFWIAVVGGATAIGGAVVLTTRSK